MKTKLILLTDAVQKFITNLRAKGRARRTIAIYEYRLDPLLIHASQKDVKTIDAITADFIDGYVITLHDSKLAQATVSGHLQALKAFFSFCVFRGYLKQNPTAHIHRARRLVQADIKPISQPDLEAVLFQAEQDKDPLDLALVMFLADTGCRAGEVASLNLVDMDLDRCEAVVTGKTGRRIVDFTPVTATAITEFLKVRQGTDPQAVFTTRAGRISYMAIYRRCRELGKHCHARRSNPQSIRHRVGQGWIDKGANLEVVRQKLGHADITTTAAFYAHQDRDRMRAATRRYSLLKK